MRWIKAALLALVVAAGGAIAGWLYWQQQLDAPIALSASEVYEVRPGMGASQIIAELEARGIIAAQWPYQLLGVFEPQRLRGLRAGEFRLEPGMNAAQLLAKLSSNDVVTYRLTVPEGRTFADMRRLLGDAEALDHETRDMSDAELMTALGHEGELPEGRFFPDTYVWRRGVSDMEIFQRAYDRMASVLREVWQSRDDDLPIDTPYEALILASLIEKETGVAAERSRIAGVFKRRLERGMRLQTDPTVIYGLGEDYDGSLSRADLERRTDWNTYVISGLPPTPIALPGRAALEAAVHPAAGSALYFVARGNGEHQFSDTLAEHNAAVRRYILGEGESP
ncbi:endolytic transglycosylase MltG [Kushneria aurantia]|uniref:Endolytic murein transglycosylase n=1 Tax=Kushneria aurantia TaxID=504092 RepID=A0ABV6G6W2_9GAMM|nr:endolytic transglycosylase MltG [Kushneria aurantia]